MDRFIFGLIALVCVGVLGAIGYGIYYEVNDPGQGTVTGTQHDPAYVYNQCTGQPPICTVNYQDECWRVKYNDGRHDGDECVPESEFAHYRKGDHYPREQGAPTR